MLWKTSWETLGYHTKKQVLEQKIYMSVSTCH